MALRFLTAIVSFKFGWWPGTQNLRSDPDHLRRPPPSSAIWRMNCLTSPNCFWAKTDKMIIIEALDQNRSFHQRLTQIEASEARWLRMSEKKKGYSMTCASRPFILPKGSRWTLEKPTVDLITGSFDQKTSAFWVWVLFSPLFWRSPSVDGRNPAPVDMDNISFFTGFHIQQVVSRIFSCFFHQQYPKNFTEIQSPQI